MLSPTQADASPAGSADLARNPARQVRYATPAAAGSEMRPRAPTVGAPLAVGASVQAQGNRARARPQVLDDDALTATSRAHGDDRQVVA